MPKRIIITATYDGDANDIFLGALEPAEAEAASSGFTTFKGMPDHPLREGETYTLDVTTLKIFKNKGYQIHMEKVDPEARIFISREKGGAIKSWLHQMNVVQDGAQAIWTDDVTIEAGLLTPLVARIGAGMYRHRHKARGPVSLKSKIVTVPDLPDEFFEPVQTQRLTLRPVTHDDAKVIKSNINDPRVYKNVARIAPGQTLSQTLDWISTHAPLRQTGNVLTYAITLDENLIGIISLERAAKSQPPGIGYWIAPDYWGHGYATEAGQGLLEFAKRHWGDKPVHSNYFLDNPASGRVLEKLGFTEVGEGECYCAGRDEVLTHKVMLRKADYTA